MGVPSWQMLIERRDRERDPRRQKMLQVVIDHIDAEAEGDVTKTVSTLSEDVRYRFWGARANTEAAPADKQGARDLYQWLADEGLLRFEFEVTHVTVGDDAIVTESVVRQGMTPELLADSGEPVPDGLTPGSSYLIEYQLLTIWSINDELQISGETLYFGTGFNVVRQLKPGEMPHLQGPAQ